MQEQSYTYRGHLVTLFPGFCNMFCEIFWVHPKSGKLDYIESYHVPGTASEVKETLENRVDSIINKDERY